MNSMNNPYNQQDNYINQYGQTQQQAQAYQNQNNQVDVKSQLDKWAIIAFIGSIIGLLSPFIGGLGLMGQLLIYYIASIGMKSNKRGLAIAAMVINTIGVTIMVVGLGLKLLSIFI